jgi:hypothetical protein
LPRLARLTAVPMALIVEFDHSYDFPLRGSTWVLLLLMMTSFVTTRFFVTREMVDRNEQPGVVKITREEKAHVRQIVAVALAHAFGIAVLLSAIFSSSYELKDEAHRQKNATVPTYDRAPGPLVAWVETILNRVDAVSQEHDLPRFIGLVPREVKLDIGTIFAKAKHPLTPKLAEHSTFKFYPTIILTWTALGLFFGVFLEGFMSGARLRGAARDAIG